VKGGTAVKLLRLGIVAAALPLLGAATMALAHHSFAAEFDAERPLELEGIVKEMRFSNPHSWIYVTVTLKSGEKQEWAVEGAAPNALLRRGFSKSSLPAGTEVRVRGYQARDRTNRLAGSNVVLTKTGEKLFVGSQGTGAPGEIENPEGAPPAK
jgi:hypothetical protein